VNLEDINSKSSNSEISELGLSILNKNEQDYNIMMCLILQKNYQKALTFLNTLAGNLGSQYDSKLLLIKGLLYNAVNEQVNGYIIRE